MSRISTWKEKEILYLKKYYPTKGCKYVARQLGIKRSAVYSKAAKLGIRVLINTSPNAYLPREIIFIKKYYPLKGSYYVSKMLGRSKNSILSKVRQLRVESKSLLNWSEEEINYLKKWYGKKRPSEIARRLKRTTQAIVARARMIGLFISMQRKWTNQEEHYLIKNFRDMTYKQIGKHLNRTERSVQHRVTKMKMIKLPERNWTVQEKRFLTRFYGKKTNEEIAKRLDRTPGSIISYANLKKLKKPHPFDYTEKEKDFIRENYLKMTNEQIAIKLNAKLSRVKRTRKGIGAMGSVLGLVGSDKKKELTIKGKKNLYSEKEKMFIRKNYVKLTNKEIAKKLNRPISGINDIAMRLGLTNLPGKQNLWIRGDVETYYTEEEKEFIRKNYPKMTNQQLAKKLDRSVSGIKYLINKLGLSGRPKRRKS